MQISTFFTLCTQKDVFHILVTDLQPVTLDCNAVARIYV